MGQSKGSGIEQGTTAEIFDQQQPTRMREFRKFPELGLRREADNTEITPVHRENGYCLVGDRLGIVADIRSVRCPDLDQTGTTLPEHIGDAEPPPISTA